jgi:hypothetical protein
MLANKQETSIGVWIRFDTYDLEIVPSLAGAIHRFDYGGSPVEIRLPKRPMRKDWKKDDAPITANGWRVRNGRDIPLSFGIHEVDAYLSTGLTRRIRVDAIGRVNVGLFSKRERKGLDRITKSGATVLEAAFQYWVDVLRWKSGNATLCQVRSQRQKTSRGAYLVDDMTKASIYRPAMNFVIPARKPITARDWRFTGQALSEKSAVPIWQLFIAEAGQKARLGDNRSAILDLAIASETLIRQLAILSSLKPRTNRAAEKLFSQAPISRVLDEWAGLGFGSADWQRLETERKAVKQVLDKRNAIMHRGEEPGFGPAGIGQFISHVKRFLNFGEQEMNRLRE